MAQNHENLDEHDLANLADDLLAARTLLNNTLSQAAKAGIIVDLDVGTRKGTLVPDDRLVPCLITAPRVSPQRAVPPLVTDSVDDLILDIYAAVRVFNRVLEAAVLAALPMDFHIVAPVSVAAAHAQGIGMIAYVEALPEIETATDRLARNVTDVLLSALAEAAEALRGVKPEMGTAAMAALQKAVYVLRQHGVETPDIPMSWD